MNFDSFIKELTQFDYRVESTDHTWDIIFPDQKDKYHHLRVTKYQEIFYVANVDGNLYTLERTPDKGVDISASQDSASYGHVKDPVAVWNNLITYACKWLKIVKKDWIKSNKQVLESYPFNRRYGIVSSSLIRSSIPEIYRIDKELGKEKIKKFIGLVESGYFRDDKNTTKKSMTANEFFDYCKIAYLAGQRKDDYVDASLSGREMYARYADGRDEGLLEIAENSKKEFADWIDGKHPKKTMGGHPWEIKRGGNTTHIDLSVYRPTFCPKDAFTINLRGRSINRLKETICMFLGIYDAGLPITIDDPEGVRKRLLAQDNVGIIPCFNSLHRANQHYYEHKDVYDVLYYDDLGRYKRRIKPFITWESLPILKPRGA